MLANLATLILASCSGPLFDAPDIEEKLINADVVSASCETITLDLKDGTYLFVSSPMLQELEQIVPQDRSSISCGIRDKGIVVGSSFVDDGDSSFSIGQTAFVPPTESKGVYEITLPDIDYRAITSANLTIRATTFGSLNSLNVYDANADYDSITGLSSLNQTYLANSSYSAGHFSFNLLSATQSHLFYEGSEIMTLIVSGGVSNAVRSVYTVESSSAPSFSIVYSAPTVTGVGNAPLYETIYGTDPNCFGFALVSPSTVNKSFPSTLTVNQTSLESIIVPEIKATIGRPFSTDYYMHVREISSLSAPIYNYEWRIAFRVAYWGSSYYDYHFLRQNSNGRWAEKFPGSSSSLLGVGVNPENHSWNNIYDSPIVYFAVSEGILN